MFTRTKIYTVDHGPKPYYNSIDLSVLATDMISRMGNYHKLLIVLLSFNNFIVAINHLVTTFHSFAPKFYCRDNNETTCETDCRDGYEFQSEYVTIASEFSLVCSTRLLAPLVNTLYFSGVIVGAFLCGTLADIWGRKWIILICLYAQGVLGALLYFIVNLELVMIVRTIQGVFVQGLQGVTYALLLEHAPPTKRTAAGVLFEIAWALGILYLAASSYFAPNWHNLHLILTIPTVLTLVYIWLIPESITWLIIRKRFDSAYSLAVKLAKRNNDKQFYDDLQTLTLNTSDGVNESNTDENVGLEHITKPTIKDMFHNRILRKHTIIMCFIFFAVPLCYWGIAFFLPNLAGDRHLNFAIGGVIEMLAYSVSFVFYSRFGRRLPLAIYQYGNGTLLIVMVILSVSVGSAGDVDGHWSKTLTTILALLTRAFTASSFCGMFIFAAEIFPTGCRGAAMGLCGLFARVGTMLSPQLSVLGEFAFTTLPIIIMGAVGLIAGTASLYLPETLGIALPNSIEDVNELWGRNP